MESTGPVENGKQAIGFGDEKKDTVYVGSKITG